MAAADLPRPASRATTRYVITQEARAVSTVLDRPRVDRGALAASPGADEILTAGRARASSPSCTSGSTRGGWSCWRARIERQTALRRRRAARFPAKKRRDIRESDWTVGAIPADLQDRRVEITGPTNAKMVINALNSGAKVFMADFEDATAPVWDELVQGQVNLRDRWLGTLAFTDPDSGKHYALGDQSGGADGPPARLASCRSGI